MTHLHANNSLQIWEVHNAISKYRIFPCCTGLSSVVLIIASATWCQKKIPNVLFHPWRMTQVQLENLLLLGYSRKYRRKLRVFISTWPLKIPIYCMSNGFFFHSWNHQHQHPKNECLSSCSLYPSGKSWHKESSNGAKWQVQVGCEKVGSCPDLLRSKKTVAEQNSILKLCRQ